MLPPLSPWPKPGGRFLPPERSEGGRQGGVGLSRQLSRSGGRGSRSQRLWGGGEHRSNLSSQPSHRRKSTGALCWRVTWGKMPSPAESPSAGIQSHPADSLRRFGHTDHIGLGYATKGSHDHESSIAGEVDHRIAGDRLRGRYRDQWTSEVQADLPNHGQGRLRYEAGSHRQCRLAYGHAPRGR